MEIDVREATLDDQQVRNLFAYLRSTLPLNPIPAEQ